MLMLTKILEKHLEKFVCINYNLYICIVIKSTDKTLQKILKNICKYQLNFVPL